MGLKANERYAVKMLEFCVGDEQELMSIDEMLAAGWTRSALLDFVRERWRKEGVDRFSLLTSVIGYLNERTDCPE